MTIGKTGKPLVIVGIFFFLFLIGIALLLSLEKNPSRGTFVKVVKFEQKKTPLFIQEVVRYPAYGNVTPFLLAGNKSIKIGVSSQTDALNFGVLSENLTVRKFINLRNNKESKVKVCFFSYGGIKPFVRIKGNNFIMGGKEAREVEIAFNATKIGSYLGEIDVVIRRPRYGLLQYFLPLVKC